jgi:hypothetical protein
MTRKAKIRKLQTEIRKKQSDCQVEFHKAAARLCGALLLSPPNRQKSENAEREFQKVVSKLNALRSELCVVELLLIGMDDQSDD